MICWFFPITTTSENDIPKKWQLYSMGWACIKPVDIVHTGPPISTALQPSTEDMNWTWIIVQRSAQKPFWTQTFHLKALCRPNTPLMAPAHLVGIGLSHPDNVPHHRKWSKMARGKWELKVWTWPQTSPDHKSEWDVAKKMTIPIVPRLGSYKDSRAPLRGVQYLWRVATGTVGCKVGHPRTGLAVAFSNKTESGIFVGLVNPSCPSHTVPIFSVQWFKWHPDACHNLAFVSRTLNCSEIISVIHFNCQWL